MSSPKDSILPRLRSLALVALLISSAALISSCSELGYYLQAAGGHMQVIAHREPIADLLTQADTPPELKEKLTTIRNIRRFASDDLGLPENGSYQSYVALDRPYVVWNVVATPEFSLTPRTWCFPIAGCVSYRGYFNRQDAEEFAAGLRQEGYDTIVSGVPAYSTLSWFDDPALSTFSSWPTSSVARLIFHELAHQKLYLPDSSAFNESFATAVELTGTERWLSRFGSDADRQQHQLRLEREQQFHALTAVTRQQLEGLYRSKQGSTQKKQNKERIFTALKEDYQQLKEQWGGYSGYDRWFDTINNAKFAAINTYHRWVPAFRQILKDADDDLLIFYRHCAELSRQSDAERTRLLEQLITPQLDAEAPAAPAARERSS